MRILLFLLYTRRTLVRVFFCLFFVVAACKYWCYKCVVILIGTCNLKWRCGRSNKASNFSKAFRSMFFTPFANIPTREKQRFFIIVISCSLMPSKVEFKIVFIRSVWVRMNVIHLSIFSSCPQWIKFQIFQ